MPLQARISRAICGSVRHISVSRESPLAKVFSDEIRRRISRRGHRPHGELFGAHELRSPAVPSLGEPPQPIRSPPALFSASMTMKEDHISEMSEADRARIGRILTDAAGAVGWNVAWGQAYLDVWVTEHRMRAERQATERLTAATWALVLATCVLALAAIGLLIVTASYLELASVMSPILNLR